MRLVTGFPLLRPVFNSESDHVVFVEDKVMQFFTEYFGFPY
jgi:hypothetical protein